MTELGSSMPDFVLTDVVDGAVVTQEDLAGQPALVMFLSNHCPYVKHVEEELADIADTYSSDITTIGICSNDPAASPEDGSAGMRQQAERADFGFRYLSDENQDVAQAFGALCTPDFFLYDAEGLLVYRGQLDGSRPRNNVEISGVDIRSAIDALLEGEEISADQTPSVGCNIKWKPGNEPE